MRYREVCAAGWVGMCGVVSAAAPGSVVENLDELIVVANRTEQRWADVAGSVGRMDRTEWERRGGVDLGDLGRYDPSISLPFDAGSGDGAFAYGQSGYGSINVRGMEGNRVAIEVDGIRQPPQYVSTSFDMGSDGGAGGIGRDYFDPGLYETIEILKGGGSSLYGSDAMGGVVRMATPRAEDLLDGREQAARLRVQYTDVNDGIAGQAAGAIKRGDLALLLMGIYRQGGATENHSGKAPNPVDFDGFSGLLKVERVMADREWQAAWEWFTRRMKTDARSAVESSFPVFTDYVRNSQDLERHRLSLEGKNQLSEGWLKEWEWKAYGQWAESVSINDAASLPVVIGGIPIPGTERTRHQQIDFLTGLWGGSLVTRGEAEWKGVHRWSMGWEGSLETSENRFRRIDSGLPEEENRVSFAPTDTWRMGWFVQDEWESGNWTHVPGLRLEGSMVKPDPNAAYLERLAGLGRAGQEPPTDVSQLALVPRWQTVWKATEKNRLYFNYSMGVKNPSAEELSMIFDHPPDGSNPAGALTVPNPDLREEKSHGIEFGWKRESEVGRAQVAMHATRYEDFIENGVPTGELDDEGRQILTTLNRGEAEIYGVEISGEWNLSSWRQELEGWKATSAWAWTRGTDLQRNQPLNSVEPWRWVNHLEYADPEERFGGRVSLVWTGEVDRVDDTTSQGEFARPPAWWTCDVSLWWAPTEDWRVQTGVLNVFDEEYYRWGSVRRGNGHLGGGSLNDRQTAPGRNFFLAVSRDF